MVMKNDQLVRLTRLAGELADWHARFNAVLQEIGLNPLTPWPTNMDGATWAEKVAAFFLANGNTPAPVKTIMREVGVSRSALTQILYKENRDKFVCTTANGYAKKRLWCLVQTTPGCENIRGVKSAGIPMCAPESAP
jgi:hypothetical protein